MEINYDELAQALLRAITQTQTQEKAEDGLIKVNGYRSVYLSRSSEDQGVLYHVNAGEVTFIEANAIKGKLVKISRYIKNEGNKKTEAEKLCFYFECSQSKYRLEVGLERIAGKDILADLTTMSSHELLQPITVAFKRGDEVVFAKVLESERDRAGVKYEELDSIELLEQVNALLS